MATLAQIEAARANGAKSKGPVTEEGRQRSSQNSTKHGLTGRKFLVLSNESDEEFQACVRQWEEKLKPVDDIERGFVLQAAAARWRLQRAWALETGLMDMQMDDRQRFLKTYSKKKFEKMDDQARQADAFCTLVNQTRAFDAVSRYESRLSREFDRAIKGLERLRALNKRQDKERPQEVASPEPNDQNEPKPAIVPQPDLSSSETAAAPSKKEILQNEPSHSSRVPIRDRLAA